MIVTMITPAYQQWYILMSKTVKMFGPKPLTTIYYDERYNGMHSICVMKPIIIQSFLYMTKMGDEVCWLDADCVMLRMDWPVLDPAANLAILYRPSEPTKTRYNAGVILLRNSPITQRFVNKWKRITLERYLHHEELWKKELWDQGCFYDALHGMNNQINIQHLEERFNRIRMEPDEDTVIFHFADWKREPGMYDNIVDHIGLKGLV